MTVFWTPVALALCSDALAPRPPAWRALQTPHVPVTERGNGHLFGAPPSLQGLAKVGLGHEASWLLAEVAEGGSMHMQVLLQLDRNPDEPCCKLLFRAEGARKVGFLLLACEEQGSALRGMWIADALRGRGLAKELLAVWLRLCRVCALRPTTRIINKPLLSLSLSRFGFAPRHKERAMVMRVAKAAHVDTKARDQDLRRGGSSAASTARLAGERTAYVRTSFELPEAMMTAIMTESGEERQSNVAEVDARIGEALRDGTTGQDRLTLVASPQQLRRALTMRGGWTALPTSRTAVSRSGRRSLSTVSATSVASSAAAERRLEDVESNRLLEDLNRRQVAVNDGAGRRYKVCALQPGFLNVHENPGDPWRVDTVVGQLGDGAIVESVEASGDWVCHDGGGWSIRVYDGHTFLELQE